MAKVDVVVPCYNYGRFLQSCVDSVLGQSMDDVRILIIDDASPDGSAAVAEMIASTDPRMTVKAHEKNKGHIQTYNEGIDWAESDYFLLLSADDLLVPGALLRATTILDAEPGVVLTYGDGIEWQDSSPFPTIDPKPGSIWTRQNLVRDMCIDGANLVTTPTAIGRTKVQKSIGGYRPSLPHSGDMEMWLRFGSRGTVAKIDAVQAIYRKHSSNMSDAYHGADWGDYWHRKAAFDSFFDDTSNTMPEFAALRELASHSLGEHALKKGARLVRSGIKAFERNRIDHGVQLLQLSRKLNPELHYSRFFEELLRMPGSAGSGAPLPL